MFAVPSNDTPPIVLDQFAMQSLLQVIYLLLNALPVTLPVTLPSMLTTNVPVATSKFPVDEPVNEPVPTLNLSSLSSYPINALSALPLQ